MRRRFHDRLKSVLSTDYRLVMALFSLVFGLVVILTFYAIRWIIPSSVQMYNETVTFIFITVSVFLLFPARERLMRQFLKRSDYDLVFGSNLHHLDFIARQFNINTMIDEIFPDLMAWLHVSSGRLAILEPERKEYLFHIYKNGKISRRNASHFQGFQELIQYMKTRKGPIRIESDELPAEIRTLMGKFNASDIYPFFYRRTPVGFLALGNHPQHKHAERALDLFARKAAVSIHNHHLNFKIIESHLYDREFREAQKIRKFLHHTSIPHVPGYAIIKHDSSDILSFTEFIQGENNNLLLAIVCFPRISSALGIVLSGIIGRIYSLVSLEENVTLYKLLHTLRREVERSPEEYRMHFLVAEFMPLEESITVMPDGNFQVMNSNNPNEHLCIPGWRNHISIRTGETICFHHRNSPILEIVRSQSLASPEITPVKGGGVR